MSEISNDQSVIVEDFFGIFNKKAEDVKLTTNDDRGPSIYFNPDSLNAPDKTYNARIRFLPNINNPDVSLATKMTYTFPDLKGGRFYYQSPKSENYYAPCLVANKYFEFRNSDDPIKRKFTENIRWNNRTYALIQVIEDYAFPENNGKILVWDLPSEIQKIIESQLRPSKQAIRDGVTANNVFDPEEGYIMSLDIPVETYTGPDNKQRERRIYTRCKFLPLVNPTLILEGETVQRSKEEAKADPEFQKKIVEMLVANNHLKEIGYKPETPERTQEALAILEAHWSGNLTQAQPQTNVQQNIVAPVAPVAQATPVVPVATNSTGSTGSTVTVTQVPKPETTSDAKSDADSVYDEIFSNTDM